MTLAVLCAVGLALGLAGAARAGTIDVNDDLVPAGLGLNDTFHLVFVTTTVRDASPTDINVYHAFVQAAADGASSLVKDYGFTWHAIVSTGVYDDVLDFIVTDNANANAPVSAPVYRLDLTQVATGYGDIWDGTIANPINIAETGAVRSVEVWTGSDSSGNGEYPLGAHPYGVKTGQGDETNHWWINNDEFYYSLRYMADCRSLYALSEELTITPEPATLALLGLGGLGMLLSRKRK